MKSSLRRPLLWALVGSFLVCTPALAARKKSKKKRNRPDSGENQSAKEREEGDGKLRTNSRANRERANFSLHGEIGLVNILASGFGARGGVYIDEDNIVELTYLQSEFSIFGLSTKYKNYDVRFKHFFGNSFYLYAGTGAATVVSESDFLGLADEVVTFSSTNLVGTVGIGNNWSWGTFNLGCDWVGVVIPITELSYSETTPADEEDQNFQKDRDSFKGESQTPDLMTVRFYVGVHI